MKLWIHGDPPLPKARSNLADFSCGFSCEPVVRKRYGLEVSTIACNRGTPNPKPLTLINPRPETQTNNPPIFRALWRPLKLDPRQPSRTCRRTAGYCELFRGNLRVQGLGFREGTRWGPHLVECVWDVFGLHSFKII